MAPESLSPALLEELDSFAPETRNMALKKLVAALAEGRVVLPPAGKTVNVHAHTFHSFSTWDYSPSRLVWEAARRGLAVIGSTDFDVLNAMDEMYEAGAAIGIRTTVSLETRAYAAAYSDREINSPGEPGVIYVMGAGFVRIPGPGTLFPSLLEQSRLRNREMIKKVNTVMGPAAIEYARDVLPLTPTGNATERHICAAYDARARSVFPARVDLTAFWAKVLGLSAEQAEKLADDVGGLRNTIRAKLMKKGGVGYAQPGKESFPLVEDFFAMVKNAGAVPCLAWLDGSTPGEADAGRLLDAAVAWGARVVNVIPERNWNFADPEVKKKKLAALADFIAGARRRHLPVMAGTEMNGPGQKFVDSFDAPELAPYVADFLDGAYWLYGHTVMERLAAMGASSAWAAAVFGDDKARANAFYLEVGKLVPPRGGLPKLAVSTGDTADAVLRKLGNAHCE